MFFFLSYMLKKTAPQNPAALFIYQDSYLTIFSSDSLFLLTGAGSEG